MGGELLVSILQWSCYIGFPVTLAAHIPRIPVVIYRIKKWWYGGKGIRIFFTGENGKLSSWFVKIGSSAGDDIIEEDKKAFIYSKDDLMEIPDGMGRISKEKMLWYTYDNIVPVKLKDGTTRKCLAPLKPRHNETRKTPDEFYAALHTKVFKDAMAPENELLKNSTSIIIIIGIGVVLYIVAKKMGWM